MGRNTILELVRKYYKETYSTQSFDPGKAPIPFAGRIFDDEEMVNLIDSSLD